MQMTPEEIKSRFKNMVGKENDRLQILAELNACPKKTIVEIVNQEDKKPPTMGSMVVDPNNFKIMKQEPFEEGTAIYKLVAARLDELEEIIKSATKEYNELARYLQKG